MGWRRQQTRRKLPTKRKEQERLEAGRQVIRERLELARDVLRDATGLEPHSRDIYAYAESIREVQEG